MLGISSNQKTTKDKNRRINFLYFSEVGVLYFSGVEDQATKYPATEAAGYLT
jgi:hypothetical protein